MTHVCVPQADSREQANEFVRQYDKAIAGPSGRSRVHRVSHYLASEQSGCLGRDLRDFASGGQMSSALRAEILAYQLVVLDDGVQESPHSLVSRIATSARHSSPSWWSSTVRFEQNIKVKNAMDAIDTSRFASFFDKWKVMGHCEWPKYSKLRNQRVKTRSFLDMIYRTGSHNLKDWSLLALVDKKPNITKGIEDIGNSAIQEVKIDFLKKAFAPGRIVTWPVSSAMGALDEHMCTGQPGYISYQYPVCYQVIGHDPQNKKYVDTEFVARMRSMRLPLMVQTWRPWLTRQYPCQAMQVFSDGLPVLIDLFSEINYDDYNKLCQWDIAGQADVGNCWALTNPQIFADKQWRATNRYHESSNVYCFWTAPCNAFRPMI